MDYSEFRRHCLTRPETLYSVFCGSCHELPVCYQILNCTDRDIIFYHYEICAIHWNREPPKNFKGTVLRIESTETHPGFVKLKFCRGMRRNWSQYFRRPQFLSSTATFAGPSFKYFVDFPVAARNALLEQARIQLEKANIKRDWITSVDLVYGIYCPYWPPEAKEWKTRVRNHGLPDESLISRVVRGGCHFVSKSPTESTSDDSLWRFSFSKAELILIHSWTTVQKFVYHVVRLIKADIAKKCSRGEYKSLQTYHFKTLMLWLCEEKPLDYWSENNCEGCVSEILCRMIECLNNRHCPHYFIRAINIVNQMETDFTKEIKLLVTYIEKYAKNLVHDNFARYQFFTQLTYSSDRTIEKYFLISLDTVLPLNKELSGRLGHYLAECEWFLPEMIFLHRAIEANLRLMSLESASSRRVSKYCTTCLENFNLTLSNARYTESTLFQNVKVSFHESIHENLLAKESKHNIRNEIQNAKRSSYHLYTSEEAMKDVLENSLGNAYLESVFRGQPVPMYGLTAAYKANFYYTALRSYRLAYFECVQCFHIYHKYQIMTSDPERRLTLLISTSLSSIYDEHIQVILGFLTLQKFCTSVSANTSIWPKVSLSLSAFEFIKYIRVQCERKLFGTFKQILYVFPKFSEVFSNVLQARDVEVFSMIVFYAALRQSGANAKPPIPSVRLEAGCML